MNRASILIQAINELLSSSYDYTKKKPTGDTHNYSFKTDSGNHYGVAVHHQEASDGTVTAHVAFDQKKKIGVTHNEPNTSHKVFGTVRNIVSDHMKKHPSVNKIAFSSTKAENSRTRLYRTMTKSLTHNHTEHEFGDDHYFLIHKKDMK